MKLIDVTLVCDTAILADNDIISDTAEIPNAVQGWGVGALLESVVLLDEDDQAQDVDLVFFRSNVSLGTKNAAVSISDADAREIIGVVSILTTDYADLINSQVATKRGVGLVLNSGNGSSIYVAAVCRSGTPTYTASGLKLRLGIIAG